MEEEAAPVNLAEAIRKYVEPLGGVDLTLPPRQAILAATYSTLTLTASLRPWLGDTLVPVSGTVTAGERFFHLPANVLTCHKSKRQNRLLAP